MNLAMGLLIVLAVLLLGTLPNWPHSANWGYLPSGGFAFVFLAIVALYFTRRI